MTGALLDHLWQSTLFGVAVALVAICLRGNSAAVRHGLWLAASLKFLVPFSALYLLGAAAGVPPPVDSQPAFFPEVVGAAVPVLSPVMAMEVASPQGPPWTDGWYGLWLLGSACLALRWVRGWWLARELARSARPARGEWPGVLVTDAPIEPAVTRVLRPVVLLPATLLDRMQPVRLRAVLAHEREHIARRDVLVSHLHRLVTTVFWFHPLVWYIGRRLEEERERACDEAVLANGHEPAEYAAGIIEVCRHCTGARRPHAVSALSGNLPRRVAQILEARSPAALGFLKAFALSFGAFLLAVVPLSAGSIDQAERDRLRVQRDGRLLLTSEVEVRTAQQDSGAAQIIATASEVSVRGSSLRELLALAYGVEPGEIGGRDWLDSPRYDIRVRLAGSRPAGEEFDPTALRELVTRLLAARFNFEVHVNHLCQEPCGPRALARARD